MTLKQIYRNHVRHKSLQSRMNDLQDRLQAIRYALRYKAALRDLIREIRAGGVPDLDRYDRIAEE